MKTETAKSYYEKNKERIKKYNRERYKRKTAHLCKVCLEPLPKELDGRSRTCNKCEPTTISRQLKWYRQNKYRVNYLRRNNRKNKIS